MTAGMVLWSSRKVVEKGDRSLHLKFDCGVWTIEVWNSEKKVVARLEVPPDEMDLVVREWPTIRAGVEGGMK